MKRRLPAAASSRRAIGRGVRPVVAAALGAVAAIAVGPVGAQSADAGPPSSGARAWTLAPTASLTQSFTDNALLRDADKRRDSITLGSIGLNLSHRGARAQGALDYQLTGSAHARQTRANATAQTLRGALSAELVDNFAYLDASAAISPQTISAFGVQSSDPGFDSPNRTEVRSYSVTPALRGRIGSAAQYSATASHTQQSASSGAAGDTASDSVVLMVASAGAVKLGWNASAQRLRNEFSAGRTSTTDSARVGLDYRVDADWRASASIGRESSDVITTAARQTNTWGIGVDWSPSERTLLALRRDRRYFGSAHSARLQHRFSRSSFYVGSSRDVSSGTPYFATTAVTTMFDLLFAQAAAEEPDPAARRLLVLQRLAQQGIHPATSVNLGFLTSAVTLVSRQELGFSLQAVRSSVSAAYTRSDSRRLDNTQPVTDDLAQAGRVRQQGLTLTLGHRLTPVSGLSLSYSRQRTTGSTAAQGNVLQSLLLNWTTQLTRTGNLSVGLRRNEFDSTANPYTENAVFATLAVRF